ncbi:MAG: hypothetical protein J2P46_09505, partial [Zavarzinella sp.]|nr:hypothetical protein [Zavarzinella sp.]
CAWGDRRWRPGGSRTLYWAGLLVIVPLGLATMPTAPKVMRAVTVIASFGWDAYAGGLRVVSKHGELSDGRFLSTFWSAATGVGSIVLEFVWVIPVLAWHYRFRPRRPGRGGDAQAGASTSPAHSAASRS